MNVPHKCTIVPGPICAGPLPQFPPLLNQLGVWVLLVQIPEPPPSGVMYMLGAWAEAPIAVRPQIKIAATLTRIKRPNFIFVF